MRDDVKLRKTSRKWLVAGLSLAGILVLGMGAGIAQYGGGYGYGYGPRWHGGGHYRQDERGWGPRWRGEEPSGYGRFGGMGGMGRLQRFCSFDTARWHGVARTFVKADLRLNNEQAIEFDKFADHLLPQLEALKGHACSNMARLFGTAPDRLKTFAEMSRRVADIVDNAAEPFGKFYATLDAGQKARVDIMLQRRGMMQGGMMQRGMMRGGMDRGDYADRRPMGPGYWSDGPYGRPPQGGYSDDRGDPRYGPARPGTRWQ